MKYYVYDIETYPNIFTFVFRSVAKDKQYITFEMSSRRDDRKELILFLKQNITLIGFNNNYFDYPVLHYILKNPDCTLEEVFEYVQNIIIPSKFSVVPTWEAIIPQIDLFKIWHYDNPNRSTSLKWLEFTLRWKKVQDLPFEPGMDIPLDMFDKLILYNINDVDFTYKFLGLSIEAIDFRIQMSKFLDHDVMGYSDVKIGEYINRKTYERLSGRNYKEFKDLRTYRKSFKVSELIPKFISFKTETFKNFLSALRVLTIYDDKPFEEELIIDNLVLKVAKGGLHSKDTPRIFKCKDGYRMKEKDVGSMYPASIINGGFYPLHLGPSWNKGIKSMFDERVFEMKPQMKVLDKKSKEYKFLDAKQAAYKLGMNGGGYGKTGSNFSWQYDPMVMMKVTFMGQLSLLMLIEGYSLIKDVEVISANTDGIVLHYPIGLEKKVQEIHSNWEKITGYILEDTCYSKIISTSVNDYMAEIIDEITGDVLKVKYKGDFEFDPDYHKNNSQRIVPIAIKEYFMNNVPIEETIKNIGYEFINSKGEKEKTTIFDYCIGRKKNYKVESYSLVSAKKKTVITDKVIRYYISNSEDKMYKIYKSGKVEVVQKGFNHTLFMDYMEKKDYDINFNYYIRECKKMIDPIERGTRKIGLKEPEQLKLF